MPAQWRLCPLPDTAKQSAHRSVDDAILQRCKPISGVCPLQNEPGRQGRPCWLASKRLNFRGGEILSYWPWWIGAVGLASAGHISCRVLGRPLGVSGYLKRLVNWSDELRVAKADRQLSENAALVKRQLLEATLKEFADKLPPEELERMKAEFQRQSVPISASKLDIRACLTFALGLAFGGWVASAQQHRWALTLQPDPTLVAIWGSVPKALLAVTLGGVLVGFGTSMSGGCTSGHGLSGCSRLQPTSMLATGLFVGVAILVSLALGGWHG